MEVKIVDFHNVDNDPDMCSDATITALYIDGVEVLAGDYYHDGIDRQIEGFLKAKHCKAPPNRIQVPIKDWSIPDDFDINGV